MTTTTMPDPPVDDQHEVVLGADTHRDEHAVALLTPLGGFIASSSFPTTADGYRDLLDWARSFGEVRRAGIECTGSYGAGLSRHLQRAGIAVTEVNTTDRADRRKRGKTDDLDAQAAARAVISGRATTIAKTGDGLVEAIRVMRIARNSAVNAKVKAVNQLKAIIVGAEPQLRESLTGLGPNTLIRRCAELPIPDPSASDVEQSVVFTLRLLGARIIGLKAEAYQLHVRIRGLVARHVPGLLEQNGVGPDSAAALLIAAGDNPERLDNEAGFAALCGVSPVAASSGMTSRLRLNRGGDRQANAALYRMGLLQVWLTVVVLIMPLRRLASW
jgi:transposase